MAKQAFTLVTFLGIRPDIIRTHKLLALLDQGQSENGYRHIYVHSGQHFDDELDGIFHRQLGVRAPDLNLGIGRTLKKRGKNGHVHQAALLFTKTAEMLERLRPDAVLYLGDTNTVLSSMVVAKHRVPVLHVEGGGRSFDWRMPEEKNRIIIDHISDVIYCYLDRYKEILLSEGIPEYRIVVVGNIIVDALENSLPLADGNPVLERLGVKKREYILCTLHREENIEDRRGFESKLLSLQELSRMIPVVFPMMPRVRAKVRSMGLERLFDNSRVICTKPLGFLEFLKLERDARLIISDSGTVQEEALLLGVPCLVARLSTERPETISAGATVLSENDLCHNAYRAIEINKNWDRSVLNPLGGSPSERIYNDLVTRINSGFFARSRQLDTLKTNRFAREAYGLSLYSVAGPEEGRLQITGRA